MPRNRQICRNSYRLSLSAVAGLTVKNKGIYGFGDGPEIEATSVFASRIFLRLANTQCMD